MPIILIIAIIVIVGSVWVLLSGRKETGPSQTNAQPDGACLPPNPVRVPGILPFVVTISIIGLLCVFSFIKNVANFETALILSCLMLFLVLPEGIGISSGKNLEWARKLALVGCAVLLTVIFYFVYMVFMFRN